MRCTFSLLLIAAVTALVPAGAQEPAGAAKARWMVLAECQMVVIPNKRALDVIEELNDPATVEKGWEKLKTQIAAGEAKVVGQMSTKTNAGQKATAESIEELRYPTEFSPPDLPPGILNEPSLEKVQELLKRWPSIGFTPTAFETRNVGPTVELEIDSEDGVNFHAQMVFSHVRFLRFAKYDAGVMASGEHLTVDQPIFQTCKSQVEVNVRAGERLLLGTHTLPGDEGVELFLFKMRSQPILTTP